MSALSPLRAPLLTAVTSGTSQPVRAFALTNLVVYLTGTGTISGGTLIVEEADWAADADSPYTGTWSILTTMDATDATGGAQVAYHLPTAGYGFVRVRVGDAISGGGSISAVLRAAVL